MSVKHSARSGGIIGISFRFFFTMKVFCLFLLESPRWGDSNESTQYTIFTIKKKNHPKFSQICSYEIFFLGTHERVRNSRGKQAISVRVTEVLLYILELTIIFFAEKMWVAFVVQQIIKQSRQTKIQQVYASVLAVPNIKCFCNMFALLKHDQDKVWFL